ncbi:hypothetical protein L1987_38559 [Smallanthus sonchifolius]|uniref:Uncharacterized protein n=1 Tax=Smallanthus sonchifolius TaxID=185202 RepID=A0ACB9HJA8_9ASTR|nr:hypothetical protein L1987_38559 [Smallanthus sonchifolius]
MMAEVENLGEKVLLNEDKVHPKIYERDPHDSSVWYLDNGASNHMTGCANHFITIDHKVNGLVRFSDGSKVRIEGRGSIIFNCKNGEQRVVDDVYYIPDLCSNILSLGQMTENGCKVWMDEDQLWVYEEGYKLLMQVQRSQNRLYKITLKVGTPSLVHGNLTTMQGEQFCNACMMAKQKRNSFPKQSMYRASKPFELVHTNLCGPISPPTLGGNRYFMLFVDDYTRYMRVYTIQNKSDALGVFKKFKQEVELEHVLKVKALKSD